MKRKIFIQNNVVVTPKGNLSIEEFKEKYQSKFNTKLTKELGVSHTLLNKIAKQLGINSKEKVSYDGFAPAFVENQIQNYDEETKKQIIQKAIQTRKINREIKFLEEQALDLCQQVILNRQNENKADKMAKEYQRIIKELMSKDKEKEKIKQIQIKLNKKENKTVKEITNTENLKEVIREVIKELGYLPL